jgi:hypothetical protein
LIFSNSEICLSSLRDTSLFEEKGALLTKKREKPIGMLKETSLQYAYRAEELGKTQRRLIYF